ncbi:MAG: heptaprenylglyceryl phosphate synthase [Nitrososphaeria archaeon]
MVLELPWRRWRHVTKLDPDRNNTQEIIRAVLENGTDAILVGGTQGVTLEKVRRLKGMLKASNVPVLLEPAKSEAVDFSYDYFFVPLVLNSQEKWWSSGAHIDWITSMKNVFGSYERIPWEKIVIEAYIVLNRDAAVAKLTRSVTDLTVDQIVSHAVYADKIMKAPIVYIEYSGKFGDPNVVRAVKEHLIDSHLFYGGGIDSTEKAEIMSKYATIIVGNIIYDSIEKYKETII